MSGKVLLCRLLFSTLAPRACFCDARCTWTGSLGEGLLNLQARRTRMYSSWFTAALLQHSR